MPSHKILNISKPNPALQAQLCAALGVSALCAQILINRGITSPEQARAFLCVRLEDLHAPSLFTDMPAAVARLRRAGDRHEKVLVYGDYDADGITALALLKSTLAQQGIDVLHYLPHRVKEGYGLNKNVMDFVRWHGVGVVVTADCGISNHAEVAQLKAAGIDTIITDHHEPSGDHLPAACAIINPKTRNSGYPFYNLAGVGVAYKLCQAISNSVLEDELDIVALGTIADSVPLSGENRIIAKVGLEKISGTRRAGVRALMGQAGIKNRKMNSTYVSFILAPRINAGGRMDSAEDALNLLLSATEEEAAGYACLLEEHNRARQKVESKILEEAQDIISREVNFKDHKVIVIAKEGWHHGVLGIVAARIADRFYRPAIVISLGDELCKGSARSIRNFHLFHALCECREFLHAFGGHAHAAGLTVTRDNIEDFKTTINRLAHEKLALEDLLPSLEIDMEVPLKAVTAELASELEKLEPFGTGNPEPLLYARNLGVKGVPQLLNRGTLKFWVTDGESTCQAIGFGMGHFKESVEQASSFDLVFTPRLDIWNGIESLILEIKDIFVR